MTKTNEQILKKAKKETITERQLKSAIKWFVSMHTWEGSIKALNKTRKAEKLLFDYVSGRKRLEKFLEEEKK